MDEQKVQMTRSYVTRWLQAPEMRTIQQLFTAEASLKEKAEFPALVKTITNEIERFLSAEVTRAKNLYGG